MNSLVIVLFLSGMVAMIMLRTLHKDIARYNQMDSAVCYFTFCLVLFVDNWSQKHSLFKQIHLIQKLLLLACKRCTLFEQILIKKGKLEQQKKSFSGCCAIFRAIFM